ncbi:MAG: helix-turn-helix domain-containing protein, partial [Acidiferrobacteraceae bacterium]
MRVAPESVLTDVERMELTKRVRSRLTSVRLVQRAHIVLLAAQGLQDKAIAAQLNVARVQVARWRERYVRLRFAGIEHNLPRGAPPAKADPRLEKHPQPRPGVARKPPKIPLEPHTFFEVDFKVPIHEVLHPPV